MRSSRRASRAPKPLPVLDHYEFQAPDPARAVMRLLLTLLVAGVFAAGAYVATARTHEAILLLAGAAGGLLLLWTLLASRSPQLVTVERSIITIRQGSRVERFDLVDPNVQITVRDGELAFRYYDGRNVVIRPSQVDWPSFLNVVMHYQNFADRKAVEKEHRFRR